MAIEELIVAWSKERPAWQREVMRRVAAGDVYSDEDYDLLVEVIVESKDLPESKFGLKQLAQTANEDLPVCILAIENPQHVNALESKQPLTFKPKGLTIVYGDNGSGKSGYARLLKRIARARHREDVLTDVFRDTNTTKPTAMLSVRIGDAEERLNWPETSRPELQRVLFYDAACGSAYIASESDFPFRPSALFVMDGLIEACVAVRARLDVRLAENRSSANQLPVVPEHLQGSDAARFLQLLSATSSVEKLDDLIAQFDEAKDSIETLKDQEGNLRSTDTTKARQELLRQSEKLLALRSHIESLKAAMGIAALSDLNTHQVKVKTLDEAASLLARSFESEPLSGVGTSAWKALWEAARQFSTEYAYPGHDFPFLGDKCRCVLCQQELEAQGRERFVHFDEFVRTDIQVQLQITKTAYEQLAGTIVDLKVLPQVISNTLKDLDHTHPELVAEVKEVLARYEEATGQVGQAISKFEAIPLIAIDDSLLISHLIQADKSAKAAAEELGNPEGLRTQLAALSRRRAELELLGHVKGQRATIVQEICRLRERDKLEAAKSAAATTGITKKILDLSEEGITEVVRDTFTRETERLRLERVTMARTRADRGALLHQPKLVGARQQVTVPKVLSEGERTALGLAAFFTEAHLDSSKSAVILDDPVTSLDHIRRALVASRLASLAETRQVILFTHDVAFVADLKIAAAARDVPVVERSVTRSRAADRKPGACTAEHPWKAKLVQGRLKELREELSRIRNENSSWSEKQYAEAVALWAGNLSETWERIFRQEIVGPILAEGGLEVRPKMVKVLARFSDEDYRDFDASYSRVSQWVKRHDKSDDVNFVTPDLDTLGDELRLVETWLDRVKRYRA